LFFLMLRLCYFVLRVALGFFLNPLSFVSRGFGGLHLLDILVILLCRRLRFFFLSIVALRLLLGRLAGLLFCPLLPLLLLLLLLLGDTLVLGLLHRWVKQVSGGKQTE